MTITVEEARVDGIKELIIRDNLENPDIELFTRAIEALALPMRDQTLDRAKIEYQKEYSKNPESSLPNLLNEDAVISWYAERDGYKNALARTRQTRLTQIENELVIGQNALTRHQARLNQCKAGNNPSLRDAVQATLDATRSEIEALTAEKEALERA